MFKLCVFKIYIILLIDFLKPKEDPLTSMNLLLLDY